jgi:hypothetical protein
MKKSRTFIIAIAFASVGINVNAQILYVPTGTSGIGTSTVTGNVGIGFSAPAEVLHINGNIRGNQVGGALRVQTQYGYVDLGPKNVSCAQFYTDRPLFYFSKEIRVNGMIGSYSGNLTLGTAGNSRVTITPDGNVGIGTTTPTGNLTVYKSELPLFEVSNSLQKLQIMVVNNAWDGAEESKPGDVVVRPIALQETDHNGLIMYIPNSLNDGLSYIKFGDSKNKLWVGIFNNRIFRVDGLFIANEIKVKADVWSDYVLSKSYKLPSLKSVEDFINKNGHLPEVPSEKQVKEDGVNVSEMNATFLKKIEEITLYVIELNKKVKNLEDQNIELRNRLEKENK